MSPAFVDTSGFYAYLVAEDQDHARADARFRKALPERWPLITTNAVVFETHALLVNRAREGRVVGRRFLDAIRDGFSKVVRVTAEDEAQAEVLIRKHADKDWSFCDALSFVVAGRLKIRRAISFDGDFREYGKLTILP